MAPQYWLIRVTMAAMVCVLLVGCADGVHGSANANGSDRSSAGQIRLGWPF